MMKMIVTCKKEKGQGLSVAVDSAEDNKMESIEELISLMVVRSYVMDALEAMENDVPMMEKATERMDEKERDDFMAYASYKAMEELKERGIDIEDVTKSAKEKAKSTDSTPPDWVQEELDRIEAEMEKQIEKLMKKYGYFSIHQNVLYWNTGDTSESILLSDITSIEFFTDKAILRSDKGTWMGYNEVTFTETTAILPKWKTLYISQGGQNDQKAGKRNP